MVVHGVQEMGDNDKEEEVEGEGEGEGEEEGDNEEEEEEDDGDDHAALSNWGMIGSPVSPELKPFVADSGWAEGHFVTRMGRVGSDFSEQSFHTVHSGESLKTHRRRTSSVSFGPMGLGWSQIHDVQLGDILLDEPVQPSGSGTSQEKENSKNGNYNYDEEIYPARRRRTKIVCAIGPASRDVGTILKLIKAGMNIARLNFSHGDHEYHLGTLKNIKKAEKLFREMGYQCNIAILMDTKGPEIRTGLLEDHKPVELKIGQKLEISSDQNVIGNSEKICCTYEHLAQSCQVGGTILIADGSISCKVIEKKENSVITVLENNAILEERKNMNIPGVSIRLPGITEKDKYDIENFAMKYDVDIVSGSFIRTADNVRALRDCLAEKGKKIRIHAKIESVEGLTNIHEILKVADGIHVSRGDLGMELPLAKLFLAQKAIIRWANLAGKPVVTSTQMLDSMTFRPRPTNAECSDVANAVLDGTDCVMLSAETAKGEYPVEAVQTMSRIIAEAELVLDYEGHFAMIREQVLGGGNVSVMEALASSAVESTLDVNAPVMCLISETGQLALLAAKYRPPARILVVTANEMTARQMSASRGVSALLIGSHAKAIRPSQAWIEISKYILKKNWARKHDRIVLVHSPLDGDLNKMFNNRGDYKNSNRLTNCVEIRIIC